MVHEDDNIRIDTAPTLSESEQLDLSGRLEESRARARLISANGAFVKTIASVYTGRGHSRTWSRQATSGL
jgi:DNA-directed RNA polymerase sigma subunit (sigma70/sigma32)